MNTYSGKLPVDAGMMSIVPVELVVSGKYDKLDAAIKQMQDNPELEALDGGCAWVFRVKDNYMRFETVQKDDVVSKLRFYTLRPDYDPSASSVVILCESDLYVITDPCYILSDPDDDRDSGNYMKLCNTIMPDDNVCRKAIVGLLDGFPVPVCSSGYGDGMYDLELRIDGNKVWLEVDFMGDDEEDSENYEYDDPFGSK